MVKTFQSYLSPNSHRIYSCIHCRAHLANHDELISKSFQGSQGRAYLFNSVVNVACGPAEERVLLTGLHAVADIHCASCKTTLGWKYEHAFESSQKYKEGKFIIELAHMIKDNGWEPETTASILSTSSDSSSSHHSLMWRMNDSWRGIPITTFVPPFFRPITTMLTTNPFSISHYWSWLLIYPKYRLCHFPRVFAGKRVDHY